jgi:hypothetical protein
MKKLSCADARQIDLVDYLNTLGYQPQKVRGTDYWYLSPLRDEKTPSFKVNRQKNIWFDHGLGQGGDMIDFGTLHFRCTVTEFLNRLKSADLKQTFSFHPHVHAATALMLGAGEKEKSTSGRIIVMDTRPLQDGQLLDYLKSRYIPVEIAFRFCKEVDFQLYGKVKTAIGFANDAGGYELRSAGFKGSSSPKSPTTMEAGSNQIAVFEGFFDFLSFQVIAKEISEEKTNFLILNSLAFFYKSRETMEKHQQVNLYLDRNKRGIECTGQAQQWDSKKYIDQSKLYQHGQDLNDWIIEKNCLLQKRNITKLIQHRPKKGRGLRPK